MLREGWDVRNVTTVVPLRPFSSKANVLPEQTLGRGLRRMTTPGQANEIVTVVEHPAFASLYAQELAQEGLPIEVVDIDRLPKTMVSIYPDEAHKNLKELEIELPRLSGGHRVQPTSRHSRSTTFAGTSKNTSRSRLAARDPLKSRTKACTSSRTKSSDTPRLTF